MAKYEKVVHGDFQAIVTQLNDDLLNSGVSMELIEESNCASANTKIAVRVYDKYFMRNGNRASLSVVLVDNGSEIFITAIGAGGGSGVLFNFSMGAEDELTELVADSISRMGL